MQRMGLRAVVGRYLCSMQCCWTLPVFHAMLLDVTCVPCNVVGPYLCSMQCCWMLSVFHATLLDVTCVPCNVVGCYLCSMQCCWTLPVFHAMLLHHPFACTQCMAPWLIHTMSPGCCKNLGLVIRADLAKLSRLKTKCR